MQVDRRGEELLARNLSGVSLVPNATFVLEPLPPASSSRAALIKQTPPRSCAAGRALLPRGSSLDEGGGAIQQHDSSSSGAGDLGSGDGLILSHRGGRRSSCSSADSSRSGIAVEGGSTSTSGAVGDTGCRRPCLSISFSCLSLRLRSCGKLVLSNVSGQLAHSRLSAIMGPSGACNNKHPSAVAAAAAAALPLLAVYMHALT